LRPQVDQPPKVTEHPVDSQDLAWCTLQRLCEGGRNPGVPRAIAILFLDRMREATRFGTRFENPMFTVAAPRPTIDFIRESKRAQRIWLTRLRDSMFWTARGMKRVIADENPLLRQLQYTGVMVILGKHVLPHQWPKGEVCQPSEDLVGRTYGLLTVAAKLPGGGWYCVCQCGGVNKVRMQHLVIGAVQSCGCLKQTHDAQRARTRRARGWIHSHKLHYEGGAGPHIKP
jgi:hypothetical protein